MSLLDIRLSITTIQSPNLYKSTRLLEDVPYNVTINVNANAYQIVVKGYSVITFLTLVSDINRHLQQLSECW